MDHLEGDDIEIVPIYFSQKKNPYKISKDQLYSNTPSDFDFKLSQNSPVLTEKALIKTLKSVDIVLPAMHGAFGEYGHIQAFLKKNLIPFVGSDSRACKIAFDKHKANLTLKDKGFFTLPSALLKIYSKDNAKIVRDFFNENKIKRAIIKPATGGSSIGVFSVKTPAEALEKANIIFSKRMDTRVVLEPFAEGKEFTVIILSNKFEMPVALMATEIEPYKEGQIFDFRKKYLPTNQVKYHYPARFDLFTTERVLIQAEQIFKLFGMKDFARFDGWVLDNGEIWFSDFNPVSGMEQNSFLFQQASRIGMSHKDLLHFILKNSCKRQEIIFSIKNGSDAPINKKSVAVLFGGGNSERQVSLMTGTNVWLKLCKSKIYHPRPYLLDFENNVWSLPYSFVLNHTVEEIIENATKSFNSGMKFKILEEQARLRLALDKEDSSEEFFLPVKQSFLDFAKAHKFIFIGLHGGDGENGNMQRIFSKLKVKYNGSGEGVSRLCMDKFATGEFIRRANIQGIKVAPQKIITNKTISKSDIDDLWGSLKKDLGGKTMIVKPKSDGCSTGVVRLYSAKDFKKYFSFVENGAKHIPAGTLYNQDKIVEMPTRKINELLFEKFMETDIVSVSGHKLKYLRRSGWVEVTIGLLEEKGKMHSFNPSITVSEGEVLTLEEKFQGGTGINLTPPPMIKPKAIARTKRLAKELTEKIGIRGYARIDAFMNVSSGELSVIEINTVPALTPSTVFFHQALAENPKIFPLALLEKIIKNAGY